jgi:chromate transporter
MQAAVCALIVRAVQRIGSHALVDRALLLIALGAGGAQLAGVHFAITLLAAGGTYVLVRRRLWVVAGALVIAFAAFVAWTAMQGGTMDASEASAGTTEATPGAVFLSGLRGGLLTFGGAYTVIPFLQRDAVVVGGWLTNEQFLDSLAISGILPAPLIIFGTMVGYLASGALGAVLMTVGLFLPAFSFTLIGHDFFERLVDDERFHALLDGVTAGVVGLIGATAALLLIETIHGWAGALIFAGALATLCWWRSRWATPAVVLGAAVVGLVAIG